MFKNNFEKSLIDNHKEQEISENDKNFIDFCNDLGLNNKDIPIEGNVRQGMIGNSDVVVLQGDDNDLILESIRTSPKFRGQGSASSALDKIIEVAQKRNINLRAKILPQESNAKGLGIGELKNFYEKRGFIFNENNEGIRISYELN
jgi:GNAT superfamily N-acetyltransferase